MSVKVMGREFRSVKDALHWVEVGLRLTPKGVERAKLLREQKRLKGQIK